ncbi:MAG: hypothetical protein WC494_03375 [Candidatus Pacearchaeota archaeon]
MLKKRVKENKRGSGHLEMIFSFVFFAGFVFLLFLLLKPYDTKSMLNSVLKGLEENLEERALENLTTFFLEANTSSGSCFSLDLSMEGNLFTYGYSNSYIEDLPSGAKVDASINDIGLLKIKTAPGIKHFRVYISPEFEDSIISEPCIVIEEENYNIGSVLEREVFSYQELEEINNSYYSDYENLKEELGIPKIYDFAITSKEIGISMERLIPSSSEVLAKNRYYTVLKQEGELINAEFNIKIW